MNQFQDSLKAAEDSVERILGDHTVFYGIPGYQRPYAWGTDQVAQLWGDLEVWRSSHAGKRVDAIPPYFLGSIVLTWNPDRTHWDVIDGQQRLTTLTILLAVARQLTPEGPLRQHLTKFLEGDADPFSTDAPRLRLSARDRDLDFWRDDVIRRTDPFLTAQTDHLRDARRNMVVNARWLAGKLKSLAEDERRRLLEALLKRCCLVVVKTRDTLTAMRIFQVLNDRGLDLRATDILKSTLLGELTPTEAQAWTHAWEDAEETLGRGGLEQLFAHLRTLIRLRRAESTLVREYETILSGSKSDGSPPLSARDFLEQHLKPAIGPFAQIREQAYTAPHHAGRVNDHLTALSLIDNQDWQPAALLLFRHLSGDAATLADALAELEARAFHMMLTRMYTHPRVTRYLKAYERERTDGVEGLRDSLRLGKKPREELRAALDGELYLHRRARRPVLLLLDHLIADEEHWRPIPAKVTVEHVLPQNPGAESRWREWYSEDAHAHWLHRLGNLLLLSRRRNTRASNRPFDQKKRTYFLTHGASPYALTSRVVAEDDWTETTLKRHHAEVIALLCQRWGLTP